MITAKWVNALIRREHREIARLIALCVLVGLVAGLGAIVFYYLLSFTAFIFTDYLAGYRLTSPGHEQPIFQTATATSPPLRRWLLLVLPAAGGLISGIIVFTLAPEAEGHGTDAAIDAYHFKAGAVRSRVPLIKMISSAITIGSGGSGGREGPIAQIGSGFGSILARMLNLPAHERRTLMAAGMGAGIGAIFHAPLAGAIFAGEVMYRELDIEHEILVPTFISSIVAYAVFGSVFGFHPLFITPDYEFTGAIGLVPYLILALACAGGAIAYVTAFYSVRKRILLGLQLPNHIKPAIGGLLVGAIGFFLPEALGTGYGVVQSVFYSDGPVGYQSLTTLASWGPFAAIFPEGTGPMTVAMFLLAAIALAKIATTALSIGSGGSGGVFGPAVAIGGALGAATGMFCQRVLPGIPVQPGAFALVGMAGFFAAAANTPISTIIMISEMTGNYNLLVPSMLVCILAYVLCRRFNLYHKQLPSHLEAPSHVGDALVNLLQTVRVEEVMSRDWPHVISPRTTLGEMIASIPSGSRPVIAVLHDGRLAGVISVSDISRVFAEPGISDLVIASDIMTTQVKTVRPDQPLYEVLALFRSAGHSVLPVVSPDGERRFLGVLPRQAIHQAVRTRSDQMREYLHREHAGIAAIEQDEQLYQLAAGIQTPSPDTIQRIPVPLDAVGQSIREADFRRRYDAQIICVQNPDGTMHCPPDINAPLREDQVLLAILTEPPGTSRE